ncbi:hypothetical protein NLJ89_g6939 [Agrocybe chaxingu]|uniref:Uncharacterized protein n=1 Tax=Agrocybe chaxingu TaxID=84603 RepID=A0A9W8JXT1_9AGAR|nr:hypothetical protein NLJ89_g6939 [Agrocybe chaxingu]
MPQGSRSLAFLSATTTSLSATHKLEVIDAGPIFRKKGTALTKRADGTDVTMGDVVATMGRKIQKEINETFELSDDDRVDYTTWKIQYFPSGMLDFCFNWFAGFESLQCNYDPTNWTVLKLMAKQNEGRLDNSLRRIATRCKRLKVIKSVEISYKTYVDVVITRHPLGRIEWEKLPSVKYSVFQ